MKSLILINSADHPSWHASNDGAREDVIGDYSPCPNNGPGADTGAWENNSVSTDENAVFNPYWSYPCIARKRLSASIMSQYIGARRNRYIIADGDMPTMVVVNFRVPNNLHIGSDHAAAGAQIGKTGNFT